MKALIFLVILGSVAALLIWRVRKSQAEAAAARRKVLEQRKKKDARALSQDDQVIWPVIVTPLGKKQGAADAEVAEELAMTSIEFESGEAKTANQGGST